MDNTFNSVHVTDKYYRRRHDNFFLTKMFKKAADKKVKKFAAKTAAKSGLSSEQQKQFVSKVGTAAQPVTTKAARSAALVTSGALLTAGGFALAPLIGGATAAGSAAGGGTAVAKAVKVGPRTVTTMKPSTAPLFSGIKTQAEKIAEKIPESIKQNLKEEGMQILDKIRIGDTTAAELLPKTKEQKRLEATIQNGGQMPSMMTLDDLIKNPLVIAALVLLVIMAIVSITKKQ